MHLVKRFCALATISLITLSSSVGFASDAEVRAFLTYAALMEVHASGKGKLTEQAARQIAAAVGSIGLNRTTAAVGGGVCSGATEAGRNAAVDQHAFVPQALSFLPALYMRDYVRGTLIGLTEAANAAISDQGKPDLAKARATGEVLHLIQDVAINQAGTEPTPFVDGDRSPVVGRDADRMIGLDGKLTDGALRGLAQTVTAARTLDRSGMLPAVAPFDMFVKDFFAPLSAVDRAALIKTLRDANVYRYVEIIGAASDSTDDRNLRGVAVWLAAHPDKPTAFASPNISTTSADLVAFDAHPEWLLPMSARSSADAARRVIDDLALVQQSAAQLRAGLTRFQSALSSIRDQAQAGRAKFALDALTKAANEADADLQQAIAARNSNDRQAVLAQAQMKLTRAIKDANRLIVELDLPEPSVPEAAPVIPCVVEQNSAASNGRVRQIASLISSVAMARIGSGLSAKDSASCQTVVEEAISSVFIRKSVEVPKICRVAVVVARDALESYARAHTDTNDPAIERRLAELVSR